MNDVYKTRTWTGQGGRGGRGNCNGKRKLLATLGQPRSGAPFLLLPPSPSAASSFLTIFGLELCIPWLALSPSSFSSSPARPATAFCVSRISHPSVLCVFFLFPLPLFPLYTSFPLVSFLFFLLCASFVYPTFSCVRFSFSLQFHLLATRDAKWPFRQCPLSRSPSSPYPLSPSLFLSACLCVLQCVCRSPATASARTHINVLT